MQHTPNRYRPSMKCRLWLPNRPQKMRRLSIRALPGIQSFSSPSNPDPDAQQTILSVFKSVLSTHNMWCHSVAEQLMAAGATDEEVNKISQIMAQNSSETWRVDVLSQNQGSKCPNLRVMWWYWTQSSLRAYLDSAAWMSKAKKPSRGVCRTQPQKRDVWQRSASKKKMSYNQPVLSLVLEFGSSQYLFTSRFPELVKRRIQVCCATAKLFGAKYDAIGQWAQNLSSKSVVELEPLFAQVGSFSEKIPSPTRHRSLRTSTALTVIRIVLSMPALPVHVGDPAYTQQFCDYLSLFQEGEQSGSGQHVLSNLHFRGMEGQERSNPFCHRATRGGRKHTGKRRKLELSKGVVNILQCNVTTWNEHAWNYILNSDFDATLRDPPWEGRATVTSHGGKEIWNGLARAAQQQTLLTMVRVQPCSHRPSRTRTVRCKEDCQLHPGQ